MKKLKELLSKAWNACCATKEGGPNGLGYLLKFSWGVVTTPWHFCVATWKVLSALFADPEEGWRQLRFQGNRLAWSIGAFIGINRKANGRWAIDHRIEMLGWLWIVNWWAGIVILPFSPSAALFLVMLPFLAWFLTGIKPLFERWSLYSYDDWCALTERVELEARIRQGEDKLFQVNSLQKAREAILEIEAMMPELMKDRGYQRITHNAFVDNHDKLVKDSTDKGLALASEDENTPELGYEEV